jgi:hypothetical protein
MEEYKGIILNILTQAYAGNWSFFILLVGLAQLAVMIRNGRRSVDPR